jgi:antitoxin component of MazEF toxin-antitoxin module
MHRGFLYQHLYAVGAILLAGASGLKVLRVERDEDIEIELPDLQLYVQTKTRNRKLESADLANAVERFEAIRKAHSDGTFEASRSREDRLRAMVEWGAFPY